MLVMSENFRSYSGALFERHPSQTVKGGDNNALSVDSLDGAAHNPLWRGASEYIELSPVERSLVVRGVTSRVRVHAFDCMCLH